MTSELTEASIDEMTRAWYAALDRHDALESVLGYLVDDGLEMNFPEGTSRGHEGFTEWYNTVTARFFDEVHTVQEVNVLSLTPDEAQIKVLVNWQAKIHEGQEAKSTWLGFDAYQTWTVVPGPDRLQVKVYTVDKLDPMPGSPAL
jgi:ketosteroid isomerase-like protein